MMNVDDVLAGYLRCAVWAEVDHEGEPLDSTYSADDFTDEAVAKARVLCDDFVRHAAVLLVDFMMTTGRDAEAVGHDLWLTRNGHGVGFWDRGAGVVGERLSEMAGLYGEENVWHDDDGRLNFG